MFRALFVERLLVGDRSSEEEDVGLGLVAHVVDPALALLNSKVSPFCFGHLK
jgi:hypothetical protein